MYVYIVVYLTNKVPIRGNSVEKVWHCQNICEEGRQWQVFLVFFFLFVWLLIYILGITLRTVSVGLLPLACIPSGFYMLRGRSVLLSNILAMSFAHNALALLKLDSFKTGTILLCGLFVYDIWWVFGTEVVSGGIYVYSKMEILTVTRW